MNNISDNTKTGTSKQPIQCYIALGSNMDDSIAHVTSAIKQIAQLPEVSLIAQSSLYQTKPMGELIQADYTNAVIAIQTYLEPELLLEILLDIEKQHGRVRDGLKWQPRPLDLDILLYGNLIYHSACLTIPHYGLTERAFVLVPLHEIAPMLRLPDGTWVREYLKNVDCSECLVIETVNSH